MPVPNKPKIYHIVHVDRLPSIIKDGCLWCDAKINQGTYSGTTIGMSKIKERRLENPLYSRPGLSVGQCVPFYFCPRSIMLYLIYMGNHSELTYRGGQEPIVHLEADLHDSIAWAKQNSRRWVFTKSNAGACTFKNYSSLDKLDKIDWVAVQARQWKCCRYHKQAEFLMEESFPWDLISRIGVYSPNTRNQAKVAVQAAGHRPQIQVLSEWYY